MLATNSGYYGSDTDTTPHVAAVGTFYKDLSWCGAYDMAGNVSEWSRLDSRAYLRSGSYALGSAVCNELDNYGKSVTGLFFSTSHSTPANKEFRRYCVGIRYVIAIASDLEQ